MKVIECPLGATGVDTDARITPLLAKAIKDAGHTFVVRYLSLGAPSVLDLTVGERDTILHAGLGLMLVQHVRHYGWMPSADLGDDDGRAAVHHADLVVAPLGAGGLVLWCDLEGAAGPASALIAYEHAWSRSVAAAGYDPGDYIGAGVTIDEPLSGEDLYKKLRARRYWRSQSIVPTVASRDYQMIQAYPSTKIMGVPVDLDWAICDHKGSRPTMLVL